MIQIKIRFTLENVLRRIRVEDDCTFEEFQCVVRQLKGAQTYFDHDYSMSYKDEEGDWIQCDSEEEWREAMRCQGVLRMNLEVNDAYHVFISSDLEKEHNGALLAMAMTSSDNRAGLLEEGRIIAFHTVSHILTQFKSQLAKSLNRLTTDHKTRIKEMLSKIAATMIRMSANMNNLAGRSEQYLAKHQQEIERVIKTTCKSLKAVAAMIAAIGGILSLAGIPMKALSSMAAAISGVAKVAEAHSLEVSLFMRLCVPMILIAIGNVSMTLGNALKRLIDDKFSSAK